MGSSTSRHELIYHAIRLKCTDRRNTVEDHSTGGGLCRNAIVVDRSKMGISMYVHLGMSGLLRNTALIGESEVSRVYASRSVPHDKLLR